MFTVDVEVGGLVVRIAAGLVLLLLAGAQAIGPSGIGGLVPLVAGLVRFFPLYKLFGAHAAHRHEAA